MELEEALEQAEVQEEEEELFVIDNELRTITIPSNIQNVGVESDSDVRRLCFQMPKQYGEVDLSAFDVRVNYLNANKEGDVYVVTDKEVSGDHMTFSWLLGRNAMAYKGTIRFIVCLKKIDEDGIVQQEFNTTIAQLTVLEGLETTEKMIQENKDLIEAILKQLDDVSGAEAKRQQAETERASAESERQKQEQERQQAIVQVTNTANEAQNTANQAQTTVTEMEKDVLELKTEINSAQTDIQQAQQAVQTADEKAETAQTAAEAAQDTADEAKAAAQAAQTTANTAKTNAATAQSTANTAKTNASNAQTTANTAVQAAADAQEDIDVLLSIIKKNASGQVEFNWTSDRLGGRVCKLLWSGNFSSGSITIPDLPYYNILLLKSYGTATTAILCRNAQASGLGDIFRGGVLKPFSSSSGSRAMEIFGFSLTSSGTTLTFRKAHKFAIYDDGSNPTDKADCAIDVIYGVI